jgi:hypothetical protein
VQTPARIKGVDGASCTSACEIHLGGYHWPVVPPSATPSAGCCHMNLGRRDHHTSPRCRNLQIARRLHLGMPVACRLASRSGRTASVFDKRHAKSVASCHWSPSAPSAAEANWEARKKVNLAILGPGDCPCLIAKGNAPLLIARKRCRRYVNRRHWPIGATSLPCWV